MAKRAIPLRYMEIRKHLTRCLRIPVQAMTVLRQVEVLMAQGKATAEACREAGISQQSYYRWRKEYGACDEVRADDALNHDGL